MDCPEVNLCMSLWTARVIQNLCMSLRTARVISTRDTLVRCETKKGLQIWSEIVLDLELVSDHCLRGNGL